MIKILFVEDDDTTREVVTSYLNEKGYEVEGYSDGKSALDAFESNQYDCIILDIMVPKVNGLDILRKIRSSSQTPVLMLTALEDEISQVNSFEAAADDYITKPFSLTILEKRIEALLRRSKIAKNTIWQYQNSVVDFDAYTAFLNQIEVDIKPKEIKVLELLIKHENQVLTRQQILENIWHDEAPFDRVIDVYIKNLRKKLELDCIKTVKGIGYKLEIPK